MKKYFHGQRGFTLLELLLYLAIFAIVSGFFVGTLSTVTRVQLREKAEVEVGNQLNFAMQQIHQFIRESSAVMVNDQPPQPANCRNGDGDVLGNGKNCLRLRMPVAAKDPTCIYVEGTPAQLKIAQGPGANPRNCNTTTGVTELTTSKVVVNNLTFTKFSNPPGHDTVQIELTLKYNDANPNADVTRKLVSGVSRVSAATFDNALLPSSTGLFDVGAGGQLWRDAYLNKIYTGASGAGTPSYTFVADSDSGMYSGGGDILRFSTGGSDRLELDATGNVIAKPGAAGYFQFMKSGAGAPGAGDCNADSQRGRLYIDTTANSLYICNGATRLWDKVVLAD